MGDYIDLALDYRLTATLDDNFGTTVGFKGTANAGVNFNPAGGNNTGTYFADLDSNAGRFNSIVSGTTAHSMSVRITKTSATEVVLTSFFDSVARDDSNAETIGSDILSPLTFTSINIGWVSGNSGDIYYDNITVTTNVPEASKFALFTGLLGLAAVGMRRRNS